MASSFTLIFLTKKRHFDKREREREDKKTVVIRLTVQKKEVRDFFVIKKQRRAS